MARLEFDPQAHSTHDVYRLLTATVVPRPIAWVSSRSADGRDNLAPHSFFTVSCARPPIVQFTSVGVKDTLRNVRETREFVVNFACESLLQQVNISGSDQPADISEFDEAGLTREPATVVGCSRVAESPVALECRLHSAIELGDSTVVMGRVVHIALAQDVVEVTDSSDTTDPARIPHASIARLAPVARLGREEWGLLGEIRELSRPKYPGGRHGNRGRHGNSGNRDNADSSGKPDG